MIVMARQAYDEPLTTTNYCARRGTVICIEWNELLIEQHNRWVPMKEARSVSITRPLAASASSRGTG